MAMAISKINDNSNLKFNGNGNLNGNGNSIQCFIIDF